jgi:hypothetical protein
MIINSVETKHVTEQPFAGLCEPETGDFQPFYECTIVTNNHGNHHGEGETEYHAEQNALENLRMSLAAEADKAMDDYYVRNGAGILEIA